MARQLWAVQSAAPKAAGSGACKNAQAVDGCISRQVALPATAACPAMRPILPLSPCRGRWALPSCAGRAYPAAHRGVSKLCHLQAQIARKPACVRSHQVAHAAEVDQHFCHTADTRAGLVKYLAGVSMAFLLGGLDWPLRQLSQGDELYVHLVVCTAWADAPSRVGAVHVLYLLPPTAAAVGANYGHPPCPHAGRLGGICLARSSALSYDRQLAAALWDASADEVGVPRACQLP